MRYLAQAALTGERVEPDVLIEIDPDGTIAAVVPHAPANDATRLPGLVVPGMANLHSHAFQRGMAGLAERGGGDFWGWRAVMYRFLATLTPDDVEAIAAQLYVECLLHGYTAVGEFHYLHNTPAGRPYADPAEMAQRIVAAAATTGIGLALLPVLYRHADFGGAAPEPGQARFILTLDAYAALCQGLAGSVRTGVAPHSLRAVTPDELAAAIALAGSLGPGTPIHIHVAEQVKEVADCLAATGRRPVDWLLDHAPVGPAWCLVHATHITADECRRLARSGAAAGLCQTTEANLGDGSFPFLAYRTAGGRFGIGSDSNVSTSPVEELRWLDYIRRLENRSRRVSGAASRPSAARLGGLRWDNPPIWWCSIPIIRRWSGVRVRRCWTPGSSPAMRRRYGMSWWPGIGWCGMGGTIGSPGSRIAFAQLSGGLHLICDLYRFSGRIRA